MPIFTTPLLRQRVKPILAWLCALSFAGLAHSATPNIAEAQVSGTDRKLSLQTVLQPDVSDVGRDIQIFAIAVVPTAQGGKLYAKTPAGWTAFAAEGAQPLFAAPTVGASVTVDLARNDDAQGLDGTAIYVGYGMETSAGETAWAEMLRNARYRLVYTFATGAAAAPWSLQATDDTALTAFFRQSLGPQSKTYWGTPWATDVFLTPSPATTGVVSATSAAPSVSGTTLQEVGVDEADWVKTDGVAVFSLNQSTSKTATTTLLQRQRFAAAAANAALAPGDTLALNFSPNMAATGLYLDSVHAQVIVLAESSQRWGIYDSWFAPQAWVQGATELAVVDTRLPAQMQTKRSLRFNATLVGSRRIGATLYLVLRNYPQLLGLDPGWPTDKVASNQAIVDSLSAVKLLPTLSIDGAAPQPLVAPSECYNQPNNANQSADIITLVAIDLSAATHSHAARCFTGGTEAFYMSDQSLYFATTRSAYSYSGNFPVYAGQTSTDIHKFSLNGLNMRYQGSGNVLGHLGFDQNRKSFRMGEYDGALRVITQTDSTWGGWLAAPVSDTRPVLASPGRLSIFQQRQGSLILAGELPNTRRPAPLGKPGEQLYASRFLGTRGYLVTYRLTDPLYVLDLSNPSDPFIAGELQVSGYSDYLFPLTETLLLGVGKEAISDTGAADGRFAWYQGVKLSLIDLRDPTQPREAARSIIGRRGTDATVLHNHHGIALVRNGNTVRLGLPVNLHATAPNAPTGAPNDYFKFTRAELQKFEIDVANQSIQARTPLVSSNPTERDISNDRAILWNDQAHYYQNGVWQSGGW